MRMVRPAPDLGQVLRRLVESPPTLGIGLGGTQREDVISPFVLGRRRVDVDRDACDRMAGLVLDDAADCGARLETQLLHVRQFQGMPLVVPAHVDRHELRHGRGDSHDMDGRLRGPFDHRRAVLRGRDGRLLNLLAEAHPIFDGHSLDRFIGLRRDGAERQFARRFLVRGFGGAAGLGCRFGFFLLGASEAEAADKHHDHASDQERGHDTSPRKRVPEDLAIQGVEAAADVRSAGHGQPVGTTAARPPARPAARASGRTAPHRRACRRPPHRRRRHTRTHAPRGCARPADGTRAGSKRGWPRDSRRDHDSARASARGRGSPAGRRFRRPSTTAPAAGARGAKVRSGRG